MTIWPRIFEHKMKNTTSSSSQCSLIPAKNRPGSQKFQVERITQTDQFFHFTTTIHPMEIRNPTLQAEERTRSVYAAVVFSLNSVILRFRLTFLEASRVTSPDRSRWFPRRHQKKSWKHAISPTSTYSPGPDGNTRYSTRSPEPATRSSVLMGQSTTPTFQL